MKSFKTRVALATSVAAAAMLPSAGYAQSADESASQDESGFNVIIVTARKTDEDLQKTPVAVTAIGAEAIEALQVETAIDVQRVAPGLLSRGAGTGPSAIVTYALRGNAQNSPNSVSDSAVGIYLDGVYLARPISSNLGFLDVANIQVVRGTQGTLFGRNTTGGAVQFTTVQPDGEFSGYVKGEIGNYDHILVEGAATLPIAGDELSVRVAARYTERDGYGRNQFTNAPLGDIDSDVSARGTIRWAPESMPVTLTVSGEYLKSNDNGTMHALGAFNPTGPLGTLFPGQFSPNFVQTRTNFYDNFGNTVTASPNVNTPRNFNEAYGFTGTLEVDLDSVEIKSITAYRDSDSGNTLDLDGTPAGGIEFDSQYRQHQFSQELQLSGSSGALEWIIGGFYFKESGDERSDSYALHDVPVFGGALSLAPSGRNLTDFSSRSVAVFAQANYNLTDDLRATAGLRYTWDKRSINSMGVNNIRGVPEFLFNGANPAMPIVIQPDTCRVGPNAGTNPPTPCTDPQSASFSYPAWTVGLDYQINSDMLIYAKTGGASLSGGFNTRPSPPGSEAFFPEDVIDVEAGFKGEFLNNRLQTNLAVFHVWREGAQNIVNGIVNGGLTQFAQNSGNIRSYGFELEGRALPWEGMEIRGAVSRLWSEYENGSFIDIGTNGTFDRSGEDVAQTPAWTFNIGATQTLEADWGEMSFHLDYAYISSRNFGQETADLTNPALTPAQITQIQNDVAISNQLGTLPGYGILNGRVTIQFDENIELAIWGRNMLGKRYNQNLFNSYRQLGLVSYNPGPPATFGGTATFRW
ncbi:TonB-dependent receptor [Parasphingorhabdus sp.]|uniref:TonB-dependent receptor n=1 Tax=Parasphingorhabdus sp. TaxID=2709688 RepID=UPI003BB125F7